MSFATDSLRTFRAQGVGMAPEKCFAQDVSSDGGELFLFVLDAGELNFFFPRDRGLGHGGIQENVREQLACESEIGLGDIERDVEAVVARVAAEIAADRFDRIGDLLGRARGSFPSAASSPSGA